MSKIAMYEYKCRRCGDVFCSGYESDGDEFNIHSILQNSIHDVDDISRRVPMITTHKCYGGGIGIADLVGAETKED